MKKTIVTHNGSFHTDDVFAVAALILALEPAQVSIVRTRNLETISKGDYVLDVGGVYDPKMGRFDHHQFGGAGVRPNGIPYASFGLVWKEYGEQICGSKKIADIIEEKLVMYVDAIDNGVEICTPKIGSIRPYTISDYLFSYWLDEQVSETALNKIFRRVVSMAKMLLLREIEKNTFIVRDEEIVEKIYDSAVDKRLIVFDKYLAAGNILSNRPEPLVTVYPSFDGTFWNAKMVKISNNSFERRKYFPESWAGKTEKDLAEASGVPDAKFCHNSRFLATAMTKEGALKLAKIAINS